MIVKYIYRFFRFITIVFVCCLSICFAQNIEVNSEKNNNNDIVDSNFVDTTAKMKISPNAITEIVDYYAEDSVTFDIKTNKAFLHNNADITYDDINLKSNHIELDFNKNELKANGILDSNNNLIGTPIFKQGELTFESEEIDYNFNTKKGLIKHVITQQDESFLHGEIIKKDKDNTSFIKKGKYTTCNLHSPHYEAFFRKAKVIPNDKIVTGVLGIKVGGVPLPLALPFGFFPMNSTHRNGILMPTFSDDSEYGFAFKGLGYYFSVKDVVDFAITADIYMRGSFGVGLASNYAKRYKFTGHYNIHFDRMVRGLRHTIEYDTTNNFFIEWSHQQSAKAHPTNRFSASVQFMNSSYNRNTSISDIRRATQATTSSSINFSTSWLGKISFGINAELTQRLIEKDFNLRLPHINFNISQFYPLRRKKVVGKLRWYENISMQYSLDMTNNLAMGYDSTDNFSWNNILKNLHYGIQHSIPIKSTIKLFKHISWTNTVNFVEAWQFTGINRKWYSTVDSITGKTIGNIAYDTVFGFWATHNLTYNTTLSTRLYGMYQMKKGRVSAFRHELAPAISFNYHPGLNKANYNTYTDSLADINSKNRIVRYSPISSMPYGVPGFKTSASINFSISNKLEMKIKKQNGEFKKITLLEDVTLSTGYDFAADSLRWKTLNLSGRTTLFQGLLLSFNFDFDPYSIDTNGYRCNTTEWKVNHRLFRMSSTSWRLSFSYNLNSNTFKSKNNNKKDKQASPSDFGDWYVNIAYNLTYNINDNYNYYRYYYIDTLVPYNHSFNNIINISGRVAFTKKWAFSVTTGYDFKTKNISATELAIHRDLHCWEMSFKWIPFPPYRMFEFTIAAKASMLKDLKYPITKRYND